MILILIFLLVSNNDKPANKNFLLKRIVQPSQGRFVLIDDNKAIPKMLIFKDSILN
jgi:hypothetical protein